MLNYHHLRYFRAIAREGNLTRAAKLLNVSQSSLSTQLRSLEDALGHQLFSRESKSLVLTEAGRLALDHADTIFQTGDDLIDILNHRGPGQNQRLRVGAVSTLSRNFQIGLLRPVLNRADVELTMISGSLRDLLAQLSAHTLDVVLSNLPVRKDADTAWHSHLLDDQPVSLVGPPSRKKLRFPEALKDTPLVLPSLDSNFRAAFDLLMERYGIRPVIRAEVDDMALLRLLAMNTDALALVPPVVVRQELERGTLVERYRIPDLHEAFYAITPSRRFPNPLLRELLQKRSSESG